MKNLKTLLKIAAVLSLIILTSSSETQEETPQTDETQPEQQSDKTEEVSNQEEESQSDDKSNEKPEEEHDDSKNTQIKKNATNIAEAKGYRMPEFVVALPIRRIGTAHTALGEYPCGGVLKSKADTLTNKGARLNTIWETIVPIPFGNCSIAMSPALDKNFTKLRPLDTEVAEDLSFPCGRQQGFEFKEFELPSDYACDQCTVQFTWNTPVGKLYSCSDIMIIGNKSKYSSIWLLTI